MRCDRLSSFRLTVTFLQSDPPLFLSFLSLSLSFSLSLPLFTLRWTPSPPRRSCGRAALPRPSAPPWTSAWRSSRDRWATETQLTLLSSPFRPSSFFFLLPLTLGFFVVSLSAYLCMYFCVCLRDHKSPPRSEKLVSFSLSSVDSVRFDLSLCVSVCVFTATRSALCRCALWPRPIEATRRHRWRRSS